MTIDASASTQPVPFRTVATIIGGTAAALAALAVAPFGSVLLSDDMDVVFPVLTAVWLAVALVVDTKHWQDYGQVRQYVALLLWSVLGISLLSSLPVLAAAQTAIGASFLRSLAVTWFCLSVAADVRGWRAYTPMQRNAAFAVWFVLGLIALAA